VAGYVAFLVEAAKTRKPWNDEAMSADAAYHLSTRGDTGVNFFDEKAPYFPGITRHTYYIFPFQLGVLAVWYKVAGFSLLSTRVLSILWTLVMLGALYGLLKILSRDRLIAGTAAVLVALDYQVMLGAAFGRYDTLVAALGFSAYTIYLALRERHFRLALLFGNCCLVMAGTTHPNGLLFFIGFWFTVFWFDRKRLRWSEAALAAAPYIVGGTIWAIFIFQDFPAFRGQLLMNSEGRVGLLHPWATLLRELQIRYVTAFGLGAHSAGHQSPLVRLKAVSLVMYLIGIVGCLSWGKIRRHAGFRVLLILTAIHWFYLTFYENMKFSYYLVFLLPLYWSLAAVFVVSLWRALPRAGWVVACALALASLIQVGGIGARIRLDDYANSYLPAVEFLRQHAGPNQQVNAACSFGFGYGFDRNLMDDPTLGYYSGRKPDYIVAEEIYDGWWESVEPEIGQYCKKMLAEYDLIYDQAFYRVYRRRNLAN